MHGCYAHRGGTPIQGGSDGEEGYFCLAWRPARQKCKQVGRATTTSGILPQDRARGTASELHCCPRQPRALSGTDDEPIRLVRANAKLVLPPAVPSEDHIALRQVPKRLAHIEDEKLLSQVFSRS